MIRHARRLPIRSYAPHVDHIATLQKFIYRLSGDMDEATRKRLEIVIRVYQRLYA